MTAILDMFTNLFKNIIDSIKSMSITDSITLYSIFIAFAVISVLVTAVFMLSKK